MANRTAGLCEICDQIPEEKIAVAFCLDCEQNMCLDCKQHHRRLKISKDHTIVAKESFNTDMPRFTNRIQTKCGYHDQECTFFCPTHDTVCCAICKITNHAECSELCSLDEHIKKYKTLSRILSIEQTLQDMQISIDHGIREMYNNRASVTEQVENIINERQAQREKIIMLLNASDHKCMEDVRQIEKNVEKNIQDVFNISSTAKDLHHDVKEMKTYGSELQAFWGCRLIEAEIEQTRKQFKSLFTNGYLNKIYLKSSKNERIYDFLSTYKYCGSVSIVMGPPIFIYDDICTDKKPAIPQVLNFSINDITLVLRSKMNIPDVHNDKGIRGCTMSQKGEIIFSDYAHKRLIFLNEDGSFSRNIFISFLPKDITFIDDNTLALSTVRGVKIININTKEVKNEIYTENYSCGITHHKGSILLCEASKGVRCIDITNNNMYTLIKQEDLPGWCYLASDENNIYQTVHDKHIVVCFTLQGKKRWEFKDESILKDPTGISVDGNSFIYVTSESSNSVVVISPDGKHGRKLLDETNQLKNPWGITVDKDKAKIVVANKFGPALVYHITQNRTE